LTLALAVAAVAACGSDVTGPDLNCTRVQPVNLAPGAFTVVDPTQSPCVAVPAAAAGGAEYLYAAVSTDGDEHATGLTAPYTLVSSGGTGTVADGGQLPSPLVSAFRPPLTAQRFHAWLRTREQAQAASPAAHLFRADVARPSFAAAPPAVGDQKTFKVCATTDCNNFVDVTATAKHVGNKVAIFQDNAVGISQGYSQAELDGVGKLFDNFLYPIDTTNFGQETDLDNNGVVLVLLSPQINKLSGNCNQTQSVILGYFFSLDLDLTNANSNKGEIFYSIVPDPANSTCSISKAFAQSNLAPTFIHEFQHMISFGQHAIVRNGGAEQTWLNEGLSHYAEELGGRLIPDTTGQQPGTTYTQFALSDFQNAFDYLKNPEATFAIEPSSSNGQLEERGANWLFVRWMAEQFGTSTPDDAKFIARATDFTQKLVQTSLTGAANVEAQTGQQMAKLLPAWQLANYLDDLPGFTAADPLLQYQNLNLRSVYQQLFDQDTQRRVFDRAYPLLPDSTRGVYTRTGTIKQGSAHHLRLIQAGGAALIQVKLTGSAGAAISAQIAPRVAVVRIK
jgi:hypothetical protein